MRYLWAWDFALYVDAPSVTVADSGATHDISFSSGTYLHETMDDVDSSYTDFGTAFESALNAHLDFTNIFNVTWSASSGYTIEGDGANFSMTFTGDAGDHMKAILGMTGNRSGAQTYSSQCRPYYLILPAMPGRSLMSDEYEPEGIVIESVSDDGTVDQVAKATSEVLSDWTQMAETDQAPSSAFADGTYVFERQATSAVPWTYQHAFRHARSGMQPFMVVDGADTYGAVHKLRAEGMSFHPTRFSAQDFGLWNIPFKTRLVGRMTGP